MSITLKEIEHLAKLAKLNLTPEEKKKFTEEMSAILHYVDKLQELRLTDKNQPANIETADKQLDLRDDRVIGIGHNEQKQLIIQSPETANNLIKTKPVFK